MKLTKEQMLNIHISATDLSNHALLNYWDGNGDKETNYHQIRVIKMLRDLRHLIDVAEVEQTVDS
jgi:hypothetical protein